MFVRVILASGKSWGGTYHKVEDGIAKCKFGCIHAAELQLSIGVKLLLHDVCRVVKCMHVWDNRP